MEEWVCLPELSILKATNHDEYANKLFPKIFQRGRSKANEGPHSSPGLSSMQLIGVVLGITIGVLILVAVAYCIIKARTAGAGGTTTDKDVELAHV